MQLEGIIAAVVGAISGGGGVRVWRSVSGPDRDGRIAKYYRDVIAGLEKENRALQKANGQLRARLERLEERVLELELAQDEPPGHLS